MDRLHEKPKTARPLISIYHQLKIFVEDFSENRKCAQTKPSE